jgi:manganese/iron transport system permease protein
MEGMINWLTEPIQFQFFQHGIFAAVLVGLCCSTLGCHVVLRRMAFLGDGLAHGVLPGIVVAWLMGVSLLAGAMAAGLVMGLGVALLARHRHIQEDSAIGILFTSLLALGILLMQSTPAGSRALSHVLFGNILGVTIQDLWLMIATSLIVVGALFFFHKELELSGCDPDYAGSIGLNPEIVRLILLGVLGLSITVGIQVVGVLMTSALIITPASTALLVTRRLSRAIMVAGFLAMISSIVGLYASFHFGLAAGPTIVLCTTVFFISTLVVQRFGGIK